MKWKPTKDGDWRVRRKFTFIPFECDDGFKYWLEPIWVKEQCQTRYNRAGEPHLMWFVRYSSKWRMNLP